LDGSSWTASEWLPTVVHVAWTGDEWLAAGYVHDDIEPRIQFWRARVGVEWVGTGRLTKGFVNPAVDLLLVAGERLVLKAGTSFTRSFISSDGSNWVPSGLRGYIRNASELGDELVLTGSTFHGLAAIWRLEE
jgi:hypothetical protein